MKLIFVMVWKSIKIVFMLTGLMFCFICSGTTIVSLTSFNKEATKEYTYQDIAELTFADDLYQLRKTQDLHKGLSSSDGWNYDGVDYTTECDDVLYSPVPGVAVVTKIGTDGSKWNNTEIRIEGHTGKASLLHGDYSLVKPGDTVIGGKTPIGYNKSYGFSTGCHAHISWIPNVNYIPVSDYNSIIIKYSRIYEVDPKLIHAIIKQESNYDPHAVSYSGAKGLMQIMEITQKQQCPLVDLFDPEDNIQCGVKHFKWTLEQMNYDTDRAIMAYHSGVTAQKSRGATETDLYYLAKVTQYYNEK